MKTLIRQSTRWFPLASGIVLVLLGWIVSAQAASGSNCKGSVHEVMVTGTWRFLAIECGPGPTCNPPGCTLALVPGTSNKYMCACTGTQPDGNCDATEAVSALGSTGRCYGECTPVHLDCEEGTVIEWEQDGQLHRTYNCICQ